MSAANMDQGILDTLTPEEREAIEEPEHSEAELEAMRRIAGEDGEDDVDGDDGDDDNTDPNAQPVEGKATPPGDPAASTPPEPPEPAGDPAGPANEPAPAATKPAPAYDAKLPSDFDDQVKALTDKEADLKALFKGGEIEFEDYEAQRAELQAQRDELNKAQIKAEISQEMGQQSAETQWRNAVDTLVSSAAQEASGIDYRKDQAKLADLDHFVKALAANPGNEDKPMDWFLTEAHKRVKALHGISAASPTPKADPAAAVKAATEARKPPLAAAPATLAHVPGSDGPGDVADEFADIDALEGEALEAAIAKMTPAQREKFAAGR